VNKVANYEGFLKLNTGNGRYRIVDKDNAGRTYEITCGECFEIKIFEQWVKVRMEHDGDQYYFYGEETRVYPSNRVYARI
jgi:hypothetical protein